MTQFKEGQEVEVNQWTHARSGWRKAFIIRPYQRQDGPPLRFMVELADGSAMHGQRAMFDTDHIRVIELEDCGICGGQHPKGFDGDCRDDANRY